MKSTKVVLQVRDLWLEKEGLPHLHAVSFEVRAGELVALFGPSGSGKSLLVKAIREPGELQSGEVKWEELVTAPPLPTTRFGRAPTPSSFLKRHTDSWKRAVYLMELFGLSAKARVPIENLSEGERAALQVATAFSVSSQLYVLDDPFERLDFERRKRLWQEMGARSRFGTAVLFTTRDPGIAERADRILLLKEGTLLAEGTPDELLQSVSPALIEVEMDEPEGIADLLPPVEVQFKEGSNGLRIAIQEGGDELAMRLLREGHGRVRCLYWRKPSLADVWHLLALKARGR